MFHFLLPPFVKHLSLRKSSRDAADPMHTVVVALKLQVNVHIVGLLHYN